MASLSRDFVRLALDVPVAADVVAAAVAPLEDLLVSSLMAAGEAPVGRLLSWGRAEGGSGGWVVGHPGVELSPGRSALANGFQAHLLDVDDVSDPVRGHPSAVILPALFAVAPAATSGDDVLAAYVVGLEAMARLARTLPTGHYRRGWHQTGTVGALAATVAAARLTGTDADTAVRALAMAAQSSAALRVQFGTEAKPLAAGLAAQAAVDALAWARLGLTAADDVLGGPSGFLAVHDADPDRARTTLLDDFGRRWSLVADGLWVKTGPFCSAGIAPVQAAQQLAGTVGGRPAGDIVRVVLRMRPGADDALIHRHPRTGEEGRFSAEYLVALGLLGLPLDLTTLGGGPADPAAARLAERVSREHVPPAEEPPRGVRDRWSRVLVQFSDGDTALGRVDVPEGAPGRPLTVAARAAKRSAAAGVRADELRAAIAGTPGRPWSDTVRVLRTYRPPEPLLPAP